MLSTKTIFGGRSLRKFLSAPFQPVHYRTFFGIFAKYLNPLENLYRYLLGVGTYPYQLRIRTPLGIVSPTLYSSGDLLTATEIFCRQDYQANRDTRVVLDIGSNIGLSALYFLTQNKDVKCYLYEPDPKNLEKLVHNLTEFEERYILNSSAVSTQREKLEFATEATGRYGGLIVDDIPRLRATGKITVDCEDINDVVECILQQEDSIDILKIDVEGLELKIVQAIRRVFLSKIRTLYFEARAKELIFPELFLQKQEGCVCQLFATNKYNDKC